MRCNKINKPLNSSCYVFRTIFFAIMQNVFTMKVVEETLRQVLQKGLLRVAQTDF